MLKRLFILLTFILLMPISVGMGEGDNENSCILIVEVYYNTNLLYDEGEFICIYNQGNEDVNIGNWLLTDNEGTFFFPNHILKAQERAYLANNASAFRLWLGFYPDFTLTSLQTEGTFQLNNNGDEVVLRDHEGAAVDVVVYGESSYAEVGWRGAPIIDVGEECILRRENDELSGLYFDTNSSAEWDSLRRYRIGQSDFDYHTLAINGSVTCFVSPDSSFNTIKKELELATQTIYLAVYEFTNLHLCSSLLNATRRGVEIKVLLEGSPVGWNFTNVNATEFTWAHKEAYTEKYIASTLSNNNAEVRFMVSNTYRFMHGKYAIIDNCTTIITTENWKPSGIPVNTTYGNRGWGVVIRNQSLARYFADLFLYDYQSKDGLSFRAEDSNYGKPPEWWEIDKKVPTGFYNARFEQKTIEGWFNVSPVIAPDTNLLREKSLLGMLKSAENVVYLALSRCGLNWNWHGREYDNLYLNETINAARRGCEVKILLDSRYVCLSDDKPDNYDTMRCINELAAHENLDMEARLITLIGLSKLHAKCVVADNTVFISSINWNYNSVVNNREVGVIIESKEVAQYFKEVFVCDWETTEATNEENTLPPSTQPSSYAWILVPVFIVLVVVALVRDWLKR